MVFLLIYSVGRLFNVTMGTGIVSILLYDLDIDSQWQYSLAVGVFALNVVLFILFLALLLVRCLVLSGLLREVILNPVQGLYLGAIPISLGTIVSMICYVCVDPWGTPAQHLALTLWAVQAALSLFCVFSMHYLLVTTSHKFDLAQLTGRHLFPAISCIVASATGGAVASILTDPQHGLWVLLSSYVLWGLGMPIALMIMVVYFHRLLIHKLPPRELIVTVFIPIGPLGQGGFGIMSLGNLARTILPNTQTLHGSTGDTLSDIGFFIALLCWAGALLWSIYAIASVYHFRSGFPYNLSWWAFVFPLGTFALCSNTLGNGLPSRFFRMFGTIISIIVFALYLFTATAGIKHVISSAMLDADRQDSEKGDVLDDKDEASDASAVGQRTSEDV